MNVFFCKLLKIIYLSINLSDLCVRLQKVCHFVQVSVDNNFLFCFMVLSKLNCVSAQIHKHIIEGISIRQVQYFVELL